MYEYSAIVLRVIDGDTLDLDIDLGLETFRQIRVRLAGLNAAEHGTPAGDAATEFVSEWLNTVAHRVTITTVKDKTEKYGRYLATVAGPHGTLNDALLTTGHALPWDGKGARPT